MSTISIHVQGLNDVKNAVRKYGENLVKEIVAVTGMVQARVVNDAKTNHPYRDRTGNLTQSIQPGPIEVSEKEVYGVVEARMEYASYVEFGTSRSRPYPYLIPALLQNIGVYRASVQAAIQRTKAK